MVFFGVGVGVCKGLSLDCADGGDPKWVRAFPTT